MSVGHQPLESSSVQDQPRVREIDPTTDVRWDAYVAAHAQGLVYHTSAWLRVLRREYGQRPIGLALENGAGELRGVLPLMATKGLPLGLGGSLAKRRLSSLPRTPVAGPLSDDRDGLSQLMHGAVERTPPGAQLQLKPAEPSLDGLVDELGGSPWRITYILELPDQPESIRFGNARQHSRVRYGIRKATTQGVVVRRADTIDDVRAWYRLYLHTMRHHVVPPRPLRLFEAMWDELRPRGMMRLLMAERGENLLAGSILLMLGSTVFYAFNGVVRTAFHLRPNDLLQWQAITDACREGYCRYDLGEVAEHSEGLADFKSKWGTEPQRLWRYSGPAPARAPSQSHAENEGERRPLPQLMRRGWQAVPLEATAAAGRLVYRYL